MVMVVVIDGNPTIHGLGQEERGENNSKCRHADTKQSGFGSGPREFEVAWTSGLPK